MAPGLAGERYGRINVKYYIGPLASVDSLNNCLTTGDPVYCALVRRDANGSLSVGNGPTSGRVIAPGSTPVPSK
ncbi:MAG: hypothetical protein NVS9B2_28200 [Steroidobacteraceae bacterium]